MKYFPIKGLRKQGLTIKHFKINTFQLKIKGVVCYIILILILYIHFAE